MVEELFIDYVDIEWGLRAREKGYLCYGAFGAHMEHALGDDRVTFGGYKVPLHSPLRHYYQMRNATWLMKQSWLPRAWIGILLWRMVRQIGFFSVAAPQGFSHARMMMLGVYHGLRGRMGPK